MRKYLLLSTILLTFFAMAITPAFAFNFYGYTKDASGAALNATNITVQIWNFSDFSILSTNTTLSDASGWFNLTGIPPYSREYGYKPIITHYNGSNADYVGKSLPEFPLQEFQNLGEVDFFLQNGTTINLTVINITGDIIPFNYMLKDVSLGYPISEEFEDYPTSVQIHVPTNRNYSLMIFPNFSMPVSYEITNLSDYSNNHADIQLNATETFVFVSGYVKANDTDDANFTSFDIIPYIIEPGNAISEWSTLPYNMSSWRDEADTINQTSGFYNMTLFGTGDGLNTMLLFIAYNSSGDDENYLMYKNISLNSSSSDTELNATLYKAAGTADIEISLEDQGSSTNISAVALNFSIRNSSSGSSITGSTFIDLTLNYTAYGGMEFGWMLDTSQTDLGYFQIPLLEAAGIQKIEIFSSDYAPKKTDFNASELTSEPVVINLSSFDPGGIDEAIEDIGIYFIKNSVDCDVPNPNATNCYLSPSENISDFNPLGIVMGGAPLSFRMTKTSNNITVHYVNVDLLASGPPDVLFDGQANATQSGDTLEEAWRFGSQGPEIYDEVIIGVPYNTTFYAPGIRAYIGKLYDEDWNTLWDGSINDTSVLPSDFSDFNTTLFNNTTGMDCNTTDENLTSHLCYIDTTNGMIWFKIPHFSGVGPAIEGDQEGSPEVNINATNVTSANIGDAVKIYTNWTEESLTNYNMTCKLYIDGTLNSTENSTGSWCNFTHTTTSADYPIVPFIVTATDTYGNNTTGQSSTMNVSVNLSCGDTITSNLTLEGNLDCTSGTSGGIDIGANNVDVDCAGYYMIGDESSEAVAITISGYDNITVTGCNITFPYGLMIDGGVGLNISNNNITYNSSAGGTEYIGIYIENINTSTFSNNIINASGTVESYGFDIEGYCLNNVISSNSIYNNPSAGIYYNSNANAVSNLSNNHIQNNTVGVWLATNNAILINNNFTNNTDYAINGTVTGTDWYVTGRSKLENNNVTMNGTISFSSGTLELVNSYITINGTLTENIGNLTSLNLNTTSVTNNTSTDFSFGESDINITLYLNDDVSTTLIVTGETPNSAPTGYNALKAVDIGVDTNTDGNLTWAYLRVNYSDAELTSANVNESSLRMYFYNETSSAWELESNQGLNTTYNYVWANVTHFSLFGLFGTEPETAAEEDTPPSGTSPSAGELDWIITYYVTDENFGEGYTKELSVKHRLRVKVDGEGHYVGLVGITDEKATINVTSDPQQREFSIGDEAKFEVTGDNYYDIHIKLNGIRNNKANITVTQLHEEITAEEQPKEPEVEEETTTEPIPENYNIWVIVVVIVIVVIAMVVYLLKGRR